MIPLQTYLINRIERCDHNLSAMMSCGIKNPLKTALTVDEGFLLL